MIDETRGQRGPHWFERAAVPRGRRVVGAGEGQIGRGHQVRRHDGRVAHNHDRRRCPAQHARGARRGPGRRPLGDEDDQRLRLDDHRGRLDDPLAGGPPEGREVVEVHGCRP